MDYSSLYGPRFFRSHKHNHESWQIKVAQAIQSQFNFSSVFDFGCGIGSFLLGFHQSGVKDLGGCDFRADAAARYTDEAVRGSIFRHDVTTFIDMKRTYDCVMSVETAEHILPEGTETFLDNIVRHANKFIYFTAAKPRQRGRGHINCRPHEFWKTAFTVRDFVFLEDETKKMQKTCRVFIKKAAAVENMMLFQKKLT